MPKRMLITKRLKLKPNELLTHEYGYRDELAISFLVRKVPVTEEVFAMAISNLATPIEIRIITRKFPIMTLQLIQKAYPDAPITMMYEPYHDPKLRLKCGLA